MRKTKPNIYYQESDYMIGLTSKGEEFLFDVEDFELVRNYGWFIDKGYVVSYTNGYKNKRMHRLIMNPERDMQIDHINHNRADNRRQNLRLATQQQNTMNLGFKLNTTSKYKGVSWQTSRKKWIAQIVYNGKCYNLGRYNDEVEAAKAYNKKAIEFFGE